MLVGKEEESKGDAKSHSPFWGVGRGGDIELIRKRSRKLDTPQSTPTMLESYEYRQ